MTETLTVGGECDALEIAVEPLDRLVTMARPLLGFPRSSSFRLHELGERFSPFLALGSLDEAGLEFIVVAPGLLFDDYQVEIPAEDVRLLGLVNTDDAEVLVLVTRRRDAVPTVNLLGPLVINRRCAIATQIVLQDSGYGAAVPVDAGTARP